MLSGIGFQFIWNNVPANMEQHSKIAVTWRQLYSLGGRAILLRNVRISLRMSKQVYRLGLQYLGKTQRCSRARVYIIRCVAVWKEMVFIGKIHQPSKLTNSQRISLPSPLGEGLGVRPRTCGCGPFLILLWHHHHFNPIPLRH